MDGQMCWMKEARVVRIIGERRIGPLCRRVAIGVFASIQKTTPTCHCFHCHMRRSRWSWVSPGGTRVSQSPTVSWTVVSLVRWYARSRGHCQFISCSFVSTIADSVACSILATVLSLFVFRLPAPIGFHNFQTFIIRAVLDSSDASLPPLSVGNRIVQFNWSRGKVERESNENCLVLFYLSCLRGYSRGVSFVPSARTMN